MKYTLFTVLCTSIALGCCPPKPAGAGPQVVSAIAVNDSAVAESQPSDETVPVTGRLLRTSDYCGGAAPPRELLEELATPKPWSGQRVHAYRGDRNQPGAQPFRTATTDAEGRFSFDLPAGNWCFVVDEKGPDAPRAIEGEYVHLDRECYEKWLSQCDKALEVKATAPKEFSIQVHHRCHVGTLSNCATWNGPLPPSAPPRGND